MRQQQEMWPRIARIMGDHRLRRDQQGWTCSCLAARFPNTQGATQVVRLHERHVAQEIETALTTPAWG